VKLFLQEARPCIAADLAGSVGHPLRGLVLVELGFAAELRGDLTAARILTTVEGLAIGQLTGDPPRYLAYANMVASPRSGRRQHTDGHLCPGRLELLPGTGSICRNQSDGRSKRRGGRGGRWRLVCPGG
jgi:hypothetical protein